MTMSGELSPRAIEIYAKWEMARERVEPFDLDAHCESPEEKAAVERLIAELAPPRPAAREALPADTERYRFLSFVARGGMGEVYRAQDLVLDRCVAIKVLRRRFDASIDTFRAEALLVASLDHPAIVPIYEFGTLSDGRPFFAMKFVEGETLEAKLRCMTASATDLMRVFERICDAVAYAHHRDKPVLHRDLKPQNVMVGAHGLVLVLDWGIAKFVEATDGSAGAKAVHEVRGADMETPGFAAAPTPRQETGTGVAKGTPAYMAPEQARGERRRIGPRTDVFGLGGILCRMLTGEQPFRADVETWTGTLEEYLHAKTFARLEQCGEDADLIALAKKCLAPTPEQRFADAAEVAEAVRQILDARQRRLKDAEIKAATAEAERKAAEADRKAAEAELHAEQRRRKLSRALVATLVVLFLVTAAGLLVVDRYRRQADQQAAANQTLADVNLRLANEERKARSEADEQRILAQERAASIAYARGTSLAEQGRIGAAAAWMERALELAPENSRLVDPLRYSIAYLLTKTPTLQSLLPVPDTSHGIVFHPDGKRLFTAGAKGVLRIWDPTAGMPVGDAKQLGAPIERLTISPDGRTLYCAGTTGMVYRRDASLAELPELPPWPGHRATVLAIAASPDGKHVATGSGDGEILVRESASGNIVARMSPHGRVGGGPSSKAVRALAFSRDGAEIASGGFDGVIHVYAWATQKAVASYRTEDESAPIWALCYVEVSGESFLFSGDFAGKVRAWKKDGQFETVLTRGGAITSLAPQPGRTRGELLVAASDPSMAVWSPAGYYEILHPRILEAAAWGPNGDVLATSCSDAVRVWRVGSKMPVLELVPEGVGENQKFLIGGADMAEAGNRFVMTEMGRQGRVRLWDFTRDAVRGVAGPAPLGVGVSTAKLSADGNRLLLGRTDGGVHCWNIPNKAEEWRARPRQGHVRSATLSPDGVWWAAGYLDGAIQIGRIAQGKLERVLTLESAFPSALAFTRDGKRLVVLESLRKQSQSVDAGALSWWDTETGTRVGARRTLDFYPHALVLSPEGRYAVVCGQGPRVLSFDMATQQPGPVLHTTGVIQEIAFGHGGDILLTVGTENTAALWHWPSGREVGVRFQAGEREGAFTADGRIVFRSAGVHAVPTIEQVLAPRTIPTRQQSIGAARRATGLRVNAEDRLEALSAAQWQAEVSHTPATH